MKELAIQCTQEEVDAWDTWMREEKRKAVRDMLYEGMINFIHIIPFGMRWAIAQEYEKLIELYLAMM